MKTSRCCSVCLAPAFQATIKLKVNFPVKKNVKREVKEHAELNIIVDVWQSFPS